MLHPLLLLPALILRAGPAPADNAVCPTCPMKVDARSPVVVVRGRAYRVCCKGCGRDLEKNPSKYLEDDGTPRNARKR